MSPSWRDQIQVYVAPNRIDLVRSSRGFKPVQSPKITQLCNEHTTEQPVWEPAMQQLDILLRDAAGAEITATLSNHFVRYVTLPPQAEITTLDELSAYAMFRMREVYAQRVDDWTLSISLWDPIKGAICAAIPTELLARFEQIAAQNKIKLKAIEPYLASVCDHWHKILTTEQICLALIEHEQFCIVLMDNGSWRSIRNQRVLKDMSNELHIALDQELILSGKQKAPESVYLFAPEHPDLALPQNSNWRFTALQTSEIPALAHYPSPIIDNQSETDECVA